jgi:antitoxin (DNA-binding transcriptional repressor) of toxin-antitoxin stability system
MSATVTLEDAQVKLKQIIDQLAPGEEIVITEDQQPVAKLVGTPKTQSRPPRRAPDCVRERLSTWLQTSTRHWRT